MSVQYPVSSIDAAYDACHPDVPLMDINDSRYVDLKAVRGGENLVSSIAKSIFRTPAPRYHQQLVTGHRGCGKSTELYRLKTRLEEHKYFTIYLDVSEVLDLGDIRYLDLLVSIAHAIAHALDKCELNLNGELLRELSEWFAQKTLTEERKQSLELEVKSQAGLGGGIPFLKLLSELSSQFKSGSSRREEIRQNLDRELNVFIDRLNNLIRSARQQVQKAGFQDMVIIVDQLEKMSYKANNDGHSNYSDLFVNHAEQLKAPECHIIYTVPISLAFNNNLGDVFGDETLVIPMVNQSSEAGQAKLVEIVEKRLNIMDVFESPELVEQLVAMSGGAVRDLMRLVRLACGDAPKITADDVHDAIRTLVREYDRLIKDDDIPALLKVNEQRHVRGDKIYAHLLHVRVIHEYQNGERWADLHPAVRQIKWVKEKLLTAEKESRKVLGV